MTYGRIFDKITPGASNGFSLDVVDNKLRMIVGASHLSSAASIPIDAWTHVAGSYDGAYMRVYINGTVAASTARTGPIPVNALPLRFGADSTGNTRFSGEIDEARIYGRALGTAEITALYSEAHCQ